MPTGCRYLPRRRFPAWRRDLRSQAAVPLTRVLILYASLVVGGASAQVELPVTEAEIRSAIGNVEELSRTLQEHRATYQAHLKSALRSYGQGFQDPVLGGKLEGFDGDIQTGELDQTEMAKLRIFACLIRTAGIRLDPDLIREWDAVQRLIDSYSSRVDRASAVIARSNVYVAREQNIPEGTLRKLKSEWRAVLRRAEDERGRAEAIRPETLGVQQTFSVKAVQGANLHVNFFGIELGREWANVIADSRLTYLGKAANGEVFLLTTLRTHRSKTSVDTTVQPRAVLVYSHPDDVARYGHIVTSHKYPGYTVSGARGVDVMDSVEDWLWKALPTPESPLTPLPALETAAARVLESRRGLKDALTAFKRLAAEATQDNDSALAAEAKLARRTPHFPEQDLRYSFPVTRANLYAGRALAAADPRFLRALGQIEDACRNIETRVSEEASRFHFLNGQQLENAQDVPWRHIDKLSADLMRAAARAKEAAQKTRQSLPIAPTNDQPAVFFPSSVPPQIVITQMNAGEGETGATVRIVENILQDVHWAIKGINRRQYTTEFIDASPAGPHRVQHVSDRVFIQGPGGILQAFPQ